MKKSTISAIAVLAVLAALVIALGAVSSWFTNWNVNTWFGRNGEMTSQTNPDTDDDDGPGTKAVIEQFGFDVENSSFVVLSVADIAPIAADTVSKTLTATISGDLESPKLDWSVEKSEDFSSSATAPVTVAPQSDGALTATVTCSAGFSGTVYVKATLRGGGSSATCAVTYLGIPTLLTMTSTSLSQSGEYLNADAVGSYSINFAMDNVFHSVGADYNNFQISVTKYGSVKAGNFMIGSVIGILHHSMGSWIGGAGNLPSVSFADLNTELLGEFMEFSLSGGNVNVKVNRNLIDHYAKISESGSGFTATTTFLEAIESIESTCYYLVKITETKSGLYATVKVGFGAALTTSVTLSDTEMTF